MWFIGVEVEQETSAPPPKKNPGSAPAFYPTEATDRTCWTIQTHSEDLHCARRRAFHELNSLRALSIEPKSLV